MTLRVTGPRTQEFVELLREFSGLSLQIQNEIVTISHGLINPFESATLQNLVGNIIRSPNAVHVRTFGGRPDNVDFLDSFPARPEVQRPRRSVYVNDFLTMRRHSPRLARAAMGHVLSEYFSAARPPGQAPSRAFAHHHIPALRTEANVMSDLTGLAVWTGNRRPWDRRYGSTMVRSFGPQLKFQLVFSANNRLLRIIEPAGL